MDDMQWVACGDKTFNLDAVDFFELSNTPGWTKTYLYAYMRGGEKTILMEGTRAECVAFHNNILKRWVIHIPA